LSRASPALLCAALILVSSGCHAEDPLPPIDGPAFTQPQHMVQIEPGRRLNLYCIGEGSPTVVFEAGQGWPLVTWGYVQPAVTKKVRACSYDRAGIGFSDGSNRPGSAANMVDDLHRLLTAASIKPPYVLVGHSFGGMVVRLYADTYPTEVVGMVLVDPAVEDQLATFQKLDLKHRDMAKYRQETVEPDLEQGRQCVAAAKAGLVRGSDMYKQCTVEPLPELSEAVNAAMVNNSARLEYHLADLSESENVFDLSADQVRASRHVYGDMPLVVLTRGKWPPPKPNATRNELAAAEARHQAWNRLHDDVAKLSTRGTNEVVDGARHFISFDKPQAVIDAINGVLAQVTAMQPH